MPEGAATNYNGRDKASSQQYSRHEEYDDYSNDYHWSVSVPINPTGNLLGNC